MRLVIKKHVRKIRPRDKGAITYSAHIEHPCLLLYDDGNAVLAPTRIGAGMFEVDGCASAVEAEREVLYRLHNAARHLVHVLMTYAGVVITVRYGYGAWEYMQHRAGNTCACSVCGFRTSDEAAAAARKHAADVYGGVEWESR